MVVPRTGRYTSSLLVSRYSPVLGHSSFGHRLHRNGLSGVYQCRRKSVHKNKDVSFWIRFLLFRLKLTECSLIGFKRNRTRDTTNHFSSQSRKRRTSGTSHRSGRGGGWSLRRLSSESSVPVVLSLVCGPRGTGPHLGPEKGQIDPHGPVVKIREP